MKIEGVIQTMHNNATCVAESVASDNLSDMKTSAEGRFVITHITGTKIRSVIASMDDYITNITVAEELCEKISKSTDTHEKRCE
ncbi:MAG: hypothetical protein GXY48_14755 [Methanomicrobiales archaeon]|nr:hypothetical protein [Methanomicrobiales archaeon]